MEELKRSTRTSETKTTSYGPRPSSWPDLMKQTRLFKEEAKAVQLMVLEAMSKIVRKSKQQ
ncbi:TPR repeat-containing protein [Anopheles sinensis]|uniref:TPR repeat-containing protein n=1 Tax=Anopheles sinensis TaxID=74873 RepID=A0A084WCK6_ANOSI|nr:TPR repeat-containing protein [Anopheles sinensis]